MPRDQGCLQYPEDSRFVQIRDCHLAIVDGDRCAASLIHYFEFITNGAIRVSEAERRQRKEWFAISLEWITEELLGAYSQRSIQDKLKLLEQKGYISIRKQEHESGTGSYSTKEYRLEVEKVQRDIWNNYKPSGINRWQICQPPVGKTANRPLAKLPTDNKEDKNTSREETTTPPTPPPSSQAEQLGQKHFSQEFGDRLEVEIPMKKKKGADPAPDLSCTEPAFSSGAIVPEDGLSTGQENLTTQPLSSDTSISTSDLKGSITTKYRSVRGVKRLTWKGRDGMYLEQRLLDLSREIGPEEILSRLDVYLSTEDDWLKENHYPLLSFITNWRKYDPGAPPEAQDGIHEDEDDSLDNGEPPFYRIVSERWNALFPDEAIDLSSRHEGLLRTAVAEAGADPQFRDNWESILESVRKIRSVHPGDNWLDFRWLFKPGKGGKPVGWYRVWTKEFRWKLDPNADELAIITDWMYLFMRQRSKPSKREASNIFYALNGNGINALGDFLRNLQDQNIRPDRDDDYAWFPPVIEAHFRNGKGDA